MNPFKRFFSSRDNTAPPLLTEQTAAQSIGSAGIGAGQIPGSFPPLPGTYEVYRRMMAHPTIALARSIVIAPIIASNWSYVARRPDGKVIRKNVSHTGSVADPVDQMLADRLTFIRNMFEPMRHRFLNEALRALDFGWRPFEKIWAIENRRIVLNTLKPLLPDFTFVNVDAKGHFAGVSQMGTQLDIHKALIITSDSEAGNLYGRSRHENSRYAWNSWHQVDQRAAQLGTKIASIIPMVHYPLGQSRDATGQMRDNSELADVILNGLGSGRGVKLPNLFASTEDPRISASLAGQSSWMVSFLEASTASSSLSSLTERQRYYDSLMFRGWLRPERTGLESRHGSKADADRHSDTAITDSELIHQNICDQLNQHVVNDLLEWNFGKEAVDTIQITAAPLADGKRNVMQKLLEAIWKSPEMLAKFVAETDLDAVYEAMEIPLESN